MISESAASREAALNGRLTLINTGTAGNASIRVYGGTRPASADDMPTSAMIGAVQLTDPAGSVSDGAMTLTPLEASMIVSTGSPTWARVVNRDGATCFDMEAGLAGSRPGGTNPECVVSDDPLFAGGLLTVLSAILGQ